MVEPELGPVPESISAAQARVALSESAKRDLVEIAVQGADGETQDWYEYATIWERFNAHLLMMAGALGMSDNEIDDFFRLAATYELHRQSKPSALHGVNNITLRIVEPGTVTRVNGNADDAMTDSNDGLFVGTSLRTLVGPYQYRLLRGASTIQIGWLKRSQSQTLVLLDDPRDFPATLSEIDEAA